MALFIYEDKSKEIRHLPPIVDEGPRIPGSIRPSDVVGSKDSSRQGSEVGSRNSSRPNSRPGSAVTGKSISRPGTVDPEKDVGVVEEEEGGEEVRRCFS